MISILEVENFQSHKHSILEFSPGVNVIKGTSNDGKSALIRAFDLAFNNRPVNDEMRPWGDEKKKLTVVSSVGFDDESFISRIKSKKFNGYESSVGTMEALGRDVPTEITTLANMQDNLRLQDDGYYLLNDSPGNVARVLNRKAGLEDIDIIQKATRGVLSELQTDLKRHKDNRTELLAEYDQLSHLQKLKPKFDALDKMIAEYSEILDFKKNIIRSLQDIKQCTSLVANLTRFISKEAYVGKISYMLADIVEMETRCGSLIMLVGSIETHRDTIKKNEILVSLDEKIIDINNDLIYLREKQRKHQGLEFHLLEIKATDRAIRESQKTTIFEHDVISIGNSLIAYKDLKIRCKELSSLMEEIEKISRDIGKYGMRLKSFEGQMDKLRKQSDYCPTCGAAREHWRQK